MNNLLIVDPLIRTKHSDLVTPSVIIRISQFKEEEAKKFSEEMRNAHNTGQPVIPILIDSYGGEVYSVLSMLADIKNAKLPVATIAVGKAMSAGCFLLGFGTPGYRYADPDAIIMMHDIASFERGKMEELKAGALHVEYLQKKCFRKFAQHCGHKDIDYFLKMLHDKSHAEIYFSAKEAKKHKIIDHVKIPSLTTTVSVDMRFE